MRPLHTPQLSHAKKRSGPCVDSMLVKLDENLGRSHVALLLEAGYQTDRVHDQGLSGAADPVVWERVSSEGRFFITMDLGFADVRRYKPGSHPGILLLRARNRSRPLMAHRPGAGLVYRSRHFRSGRIGENLGLHAPVRLAASRLASREFTEAGDRSGAGSEGRFLPRHTPDSHRRGPGIGLPRVEHGRALALRLP